MGARMKQQYFSYPERHTYFLDCIYTQIPAYIYLISINLFLFSIFFKEKIIKRMNRRGKIIQKG